MAISVFNKDKDLDLNGKPGDRFDTFFPGKEPSQDKNSRIYDTIHETYLNTKKSITDSQGER